MKPSAIDLINQQDSDNYLLVRRFLGHAADILDDLAHTYEMASDFLRLHLGPSNADRISNALLMGICHKHLLLGATALLRLHTAQMFRETRTALETAGIAYLVRTDPAMLKIFVDDDGRPAERQKAKDTFKPRTIFPDSKSSLLALKEQYDFASERSHMNIMNFVRHLKKTNNPNVARVSIQDVQQRSFQEDVPILLFSLCQSHLSILLTIETTFSDLLTGDDLITFHKELIYIHGKIVRFHDKHKGVMANTKLQSSP